MNLEPAIYKGRLRHRRFAPKENAFEYPLFMAFLDVDRIPETMEAVRFGAYNRFNWASFHGKDFFGDASLSIRERVRRDAQSQGMDLPEGRMYMLTHLRYLGYCFNPATFYFCYGAAGGAPRIMVEVNNTFGETRNYWLGPQNALPSENSLRFRCAKDFHVSPFMDLDLEYDFTFTHPEETLVSHVNVLRDGQTFFDATLNLERQDWTSSNLTRTLLDYPFVTGKVIAAIHWQAVKLLAKRVPVHTHPGKEKAAG